jgi:Protein of unknown function (DUF3105)
VKALWALAIAGLAATACVVLISILASRDSGSVGGASGPGVTEPDRGSRRLAAEAPPTPASPPASPPTSGNHRAEAITRDRTELTDDQVLEALQRGNVVIAYDGEAPTGLQADPFTPALAAAGQAVILAKRPGLGGIQALAWRHRLRASGPDDPRLQAFIDAYLGQGGG